MNWVVCTGIVQSSAEMLSALPAQGVPAISGNQHLGCVVLVAAVLWKVGWV